MGQQPFQQIHGKPDVSLIVGFVKLNNGCKRLLHRGWRLTDFQMPERRIHPSLGATCAVPVGKVFWATGGPHINVLPVLFIPAPLQFGSEAKPCSADTARYLLV